MSPHDSFSFIIITLQYTNINKEHCQSLEVMLNAAFKVKQSAFVKNIIGNTEMIQSGFCVTYIFGKCTLQISFIILFIIYNHNQQYTTIYMSHPQRALYQYMMELINVHKKYTWFPHFPPLIPLNYPKFPFASQFLCTFLEPA